MKANKSPDLPEAGNGQLSTPSLKTAIENHWARAIALAVLAFSSWIAIYYASQPIVEREAFRQTETALTAYWMIEEGWRVAYQTPAWGYPWAVPIEFPIYQSVVALIVVVTHLPLEQVGRLLSFAFLLACAWPVFQIVKRLKLPPPASWVFCAFLWSSPMYLYWGRTFMIETAAVFFTLASIPYLLDLRQMQPSWQTAIWGSLWATLGMLQKSITTGPVLLVFLIILFAPSLRNWRSAISLRRLAHIMLAIGLPLLIGVLWTVYADSIKNMNFVGRELTLEFRLSNHYLGTIGQRLSPGALKEIFWHRILEQNAAGFLGLALLLAALLSPLKDLRKLVSICLVLGALPILLFFNVSLMLDYYQVSSTFFFLAALTLCCVVWLPTVIRWRGAVALVVSVLVIANLFNFWIGPGRAVRSQPDTIHTKNLAIGDVIKRYTSENSGIIVFGLHQGLASISPEIPYLSQRKGFTVPDWAEDKLNNNLLSYLGGRELGAMVFCSTMNKEGYNRLIASYSESPVPHLFVIHSCHIWLPHAQIVVLPNGTSILPTRFIE
jgi:hypothetical protein